MPSVFTRADNTIFPPLTIDKNCFLFQQKDLPLSNLDSGEEKQYIELIAEQNFSNYVLYQQFFYHSLHLMSSMRNPPRKLTGRGGSCMPSPTPPQWRPGGKASSYSLPSVRCSVLYQILCHSDFLTFVPIETIIISIISVQIKFLLVFKAVFYAYL